jgi:hypothetical protein
MKKRASKKEILYLHVDTETKRWLKSLCAKQVGRVSQSTMAERIFVAAKKNPNLFKAA